MADSQDQIPHLATILHYNQTEIGQEKGKEKRVQCSWTIVTAGEWDPTFLMKMVSLLFSST